VAARGPLGSHWDPIGTTGLGHPIFQGADLQVETSRNIPGQSLPGLKRKHGTWEIRDSNATNGICIYIIYISIYIYLYIYIYINQDIPIKPMKSDCLRFFLDIDESVSRPVV
jgi:hypothetical protein